MAARVSGVRTRSVAGAAALATLLWAGQVAAKGPVPAAAPPAPAKPADDRVKNPRLVLAGGLALGPHRFGVELCLGDGRCDRTGNHLGLGGTVELRARAYKPLYVHVRAFGTGNVARDHPLYKGVIGPGFGFGAYSKWAMIRGEYLLIFPLGNDAFRRPFGTDDDAIRETWGNHAGLLSAGVRYKPTARLGLELWGGLMLGPYSERSGRFLDELVEKKNELMTTFLVGLGASYDVVQ